MTEENEENTVLDLSNISGDLDFTFESVEEDPRYKYIEQIEQLNKQIETETKRSQKLLKTFNAFLDKLKADADTKPIIKWPNRVADIEKFQEQLNKIMKD